MAWQAKIHESTRKMLLAAKELAADGENGPVTSSSEQEAVLGHRFTLIGTDNHGMHGMTRKNELTQEMREALWI